MNRSITVSVFLLAALALVVSTAANARMYRYTDERGRPVISNTVPQEASTRGYEILNDSGRVIETIAPAPTKEELAERAAANEKKRQAALQRKADEKLLRRFSHPDDAVRAMRRKLQELQSLSQLKQGNISVIVNQLDEEQSRAANMERSGREIPPKTLEKIDRLQSQIRDIEQEIAIQNAETSAVRDQFERDIVRLEEITGEKRTLPTEPQEPEAYTDSE